MMLVQVAVASAFAALILTLAALALSAWIRHRWPANIPDALGFRHEVASDANARGVAERLAKKFRGPTADNVVCGGAVRGTAARLLFHSGPDNKGANRAIHRFDYVLRVERLASGAFELLLETKPGYSYLRLQRREVKILRRALQEAYGSLREI